MAEVILLHLVADFMLQPKWMAVRKGSESGVCYLHCMIYTAVVSWAFFPGPLWTLLAIFAPHFIIDRWSLADKWSRWIKIRPLDEAYRCTDPYSTEFAAIVYVVIDQTMHFGCLLLVWRILYGD